MSALYQPPGGSRRPSLAWKDGQPAGRTRLTVPLETLRAASLDEGSYMDLARKHFTRKSLGMSFDMWLHELVNIGVPVSTGIALDQAIHLALQSARTESTDHCAERGSLRAFNALHEIDVDPDDGLFYPSDKGSACLSRGVGLSNPKMQTDLVDTGPHLIFRKLSSTPPCMKRSPLRARFTQRGKALLAVTLKESRTSQSLTLITSQDALTV